MTMVAGQPPWWRCRTGRTGAPRAVLTRTGWYRSAFDLALPPGYAAAAADADATPGALLEGDERRLQARLLGMGLGFGGAA
ncbi:hypothetical protein ACGFWI_37845 [Streptomyces sp. NPDC048434]|uniref:hypothetical protein n=1 Tax=Streptomyces sp. NPDC048434 TaxID=3365549 RepID=UPI003724C394